MKKSLFQPVYSSRLSGDKGSMIALICAYLFVGFMQPSSLQDKREYLISVR
jgi:hypothetical protein